MTNLYDKMRESGGRAIAPTRFSAPISEQIWDMKYRFKDNKTQEPIDGTVDDTIYRIAEALADAELPAEKEVWTERFAEAMADFAFIPAGRIVAGAGTGRAVTLFNCYVMGTIPDSMDGIFSMLREAALTMQQGGGIGYDFSTIRPKGALVEKLGADASGPLTFMDCWDSMCRTVMSAGSRRGAMMGTMRCDHPDIEDFITAKQDAARFRMFNLSVLVTDPFMEAVKHDADWHLMFNGKVYRTVRAVDLWEKIMHATYAAAEPGVIFIDRINHANNLNYCEKIAATNPCGEQPLPPYGACLLGSINLAKMVRTPVWERIKGMKTGFKGGSIGHAGIDPKKLRRTVWAAVRMMDNVNDVSLFPLPQQAHESQQKRRIGLGVTGLADMLAMTGRDYGSHEARELTGKVLEFIAVEAYRASIELAKEKGAFPAFEAEGYLAPGTFAAERMPADVIDDIRQHGIRNSHLLSIAPTGTISLYAGNVSGGIEPMFDFGYIRKVLQKDGSKTEERVEDYAVALYRKWHDSLEDDPDGDLLPGPDFTYGELPSYFVTAQTLTPDQHLAMQAVAQMWIDSSISKTINLPEDISFDDFANVYMDAYESGCKGCTTYRPNEITGSVLSVEEKPKEEPEIEVEANAHEWEPEAAAAHYGPAVLPDRPEALTGSTYKIKVGSLDAVYLTVNDIEENGVVRPFEVFLRSSDPTHDEWMTALARMISAVMRRPFSADFIPGELKQIHSTATGGFWGQRGYQPSLVAAIGTKLKEHMEVGGPAQTIKAMPGVTTIEQAYRKAQSVPPYGHEGSTGVAWPEDATQSLAVNDIAHGPLSRCPSCGEYALKPEGGCEVCTSCGHSKCG
jgi:ribonucleoside-diphosphate reductase alpha chain